MGTSNAGQTVGLPRHRWYYYKEGFSPDLVKAAINEYGLRKGGLLLDPFNGSGTVTLAAAREGIQSIGFEVNPFTNFIAKTKTKNARKSLFDDEASKLIEVCSKAATVSSKLEGFSTFSERDGLHKWLFNVEVLRAYNAGLDLHRGSRSNISALLQLALIRAAMENCNAKKDGKCLRYKNHWQDLGYSKASFVKSLLTICTDISNDLEDRVEVSSDIINGDSRKLIGQLNDKFSLCVTSPPYLNTFDYTDIYRPELFLGEFVKSPQELYELRLRTLRSHVQAKWKKPNLTTDYGAIYKDVFSEISGRSNELMHREIPNMICAYFEDMEGILRNLKSKAKKGAAMWMVVSTSAYANVHVPVDLILADIGSRVGWKFKEIGVLREILKRKTKYSPDIDKLRESVVIFENSC